MKKQTGAILTVMLVVAGFAFADTLEVLGDPYITPLEGNYSLVVNHDDSSVAYVQDDTPATEEIYRAEFLYNPNDIQATTTSPGPWRHMIFRGFSLDNNACTPQPYMNAFMVYDLHWGAVGANCSMIMWGRGNVCGQQGTTRVDIPTADCRKVHQDFAPDVLLMDIEGGELDFLPEAFRTEHCRHVGAQHLQSNLAVVPAVMGKVHCSHPTVTQLTLH